MDDAQRIRAAITAVVGLICAGLATMAGIWFIDTACFANDCSLGAVPMLGIVVAWSPVAGIVAGRLAWRRAFGDKVAAVFLFAWFTLHVSFAAPFMDGYVAIMDATGAEWGAALLLFWLLIGSAMVAIGWFGADLAERVR